MTSRGPATDLLWSRYWWRVCRKETDVKRADAIASGMLDNNVREMLNNKMLLKIVYALSLKGLLISNPQIWLMERNAGIDTTIACKYRIDTMQALQHEYATSVRHERGMTYKSILIKVGKTTASQYTCQASTGKVSTKRQNYTKWRSNT